MVRVKRGLMTKKRHKRVLEQTKGFRMLNSKVFKRAKNALMKSGTNAYIGRRKKKRDFRRLWNVRINNAARQEGLSYSQFINKLYNKRVELNRKVLSNMAIEYPEVFKKVVAFVK